MATRFVKIVFIAICCIFFSRAYSYATGIGVFGSFGYGETEAELEGSNTFGENFIKNYDLDNTRYIFGFVMDTAVAENTLFNYRLQLGYGRGTIDFNYRREDTDTHSVTRNQYSYSIWDISLVHSFGFGIVRTQYVRLWLGPQIGLNYSDDLNGSQYGEFGIKFGLVAGINVNIGNFISLFVDGGIRYQISFAKEPWFHNGYEGFVDTGIMFRIGDRY